MQAISHIVCNPLFFKEDEREMWMGQTKKADLDSLSLILHRVSEIESERKTNFLNNLHTNQWIYFKLRKNNDFLSTS